MTELHEKHETAALNAAEVMRMLRVSRDTVRAMLASGELRGFARGKVIRIDKRSVEELLAGAAQRHKRAPIGSATRAEGD
jgi:excisionase family DNA binding protein